MSSRRQCGQPRIVGLRKARDTKTSFRNAILTSPKISPVQDLRSAIWSELRCPTSAIFSIATASPTHIRLRENPISLANSAVGILFQAASRFRKDGSVSRERGAGMDESWRCTGWRHHNSLLNSIHELLEFKPMRPSFGGISPPVASAASIATRLVVQTSLDGLLQDSPTPCCQPMTLWVQAVLVAPRAR